MSNLSMSTPATTPAENDLPGTLQFIALDDAEGDARHISNLIELVIEGGRIDGDPVVFGVLWVARDLAATLSSKLERLSMECLAQTQCKGELHQ